MYDYDEAASAMAKSSSAEKKIKLVCKWVAMSYGEEDAEYHKAYSREIIRQAKRPPSSSAISTLKSTPSWF